MTIGGILIVLLLLGILLPQCGVSIDPFIQRIIVIVLIFALTAYLLGGFTGHWRLI